MTTVERAREGRRVRAVAAGCAGLFAVVGVRAGQLTVVRGQHLAGLAHRQQERKVDLAPVRGPIVDRNGEPLAITVRAQSIYLRPAVLRKQRGKIGALAGALGVTEDEMLRKTRSTEPFAWLRRVASPRAVTSVMAVGADGVGTLPAHRRVYPRASLAVHVVGLAGIDAQGLEGVERSYDEFIRPPVRVLSVHRDACGRGMLTTVETPVTGALGARVELTVDTALQALVERELARGVEQAHAAGGTAIVLEPSSGAVLALANLPTFDPNNVGATSVATRRNRAITDIYEPGSTFKAIVVATAVDLGIVSPDDEVFAENGRYRIGRRTIHDHKPYGWLTVAEALQYSSNIGSAKIAEAVGPMRLYAYARAFGFGEMTGIDLPGETRGRLRPAAKWRPIDLATASFGQGIAATAMQVARAFAVIANGGYLVRPYVVKRVISADGSVLVEHEPQRIHRVLNRETAAAVTGMLQRVVEMDGGTGMRARVRGIRVAGKTGTSQKVDPETGRYSAKARVASFVGFVPAENPQAVIFVSLDEPQTSPYGGVVAAPVFREVAAGFLARVGVEHAAWDRDKARIREARERRGRGGGVASVPDKEPRAG